MNQQVLTINPDALGRAEEKINPRVTEVMKLAEMQVETQEEATQATDVIKRLRSLVKSIEEERQAITRPINEGVKTLNAKFKKLTEPLEAAERELRTRLQGFLEFQQAVQHEAEKKRIERERAEEERHAAELAAARATEEYENGGAVAGTVQPHAPTEQAHDPLPAPAPTPSLKVRADSGALASMRQVWKYRVTDIAELAKAHPQAVQVNHLMVMDCIKTGVRVMPGLEIYQDQDLVVR